MTNHDKFLDAMYGIDERFLSTHIRRKCPTAADKVKRYSAAVIIYAAALVAIAVLLPFIIRHGEDPVPTPGNDPVVVETDFTESGETEITEVPEPETLPTESVMFNGCEFSITLDKSHYDLDDTIYATVNLENKGDETIGLYQGYLGDYLDEVVFYENGEERRYYSSDSLNVYAEAIQMRELKPGECITHKVHFTPGSPLDPSMDTAKLESLWEITASVDYFTDYETSEPDFEKMKSAAVTVEVPHGNGEYVTAETTTEPPTMTAPPETTPSPETTPETITEVATPPPETKAPAPAETTLPMPETTLPPVIVAPPVTVESSVKEDPPQTTTAIVTTTAATTQNEWYLARMAKKMGGYTGGCRYYIGVDKKKYELDDTITLFVVIHNQSDNVVTFNEVSWPSGEPLEYLQFDFGGAHTFYAWSSTKAKGKTELYPGEVHTYEKKISLSEYESYIDANKRWTVTGNLSFTAGGRNYSFHIPLTIDHVFE